MELVIRCKLFHILEAKVLRNSDHTPFYQMSEAEQYFDKEQQCTVNLVSLFGR